MRARVLTFLALATVSLLGQDNANDLLAAFRAVAWESASTPTPEKPGYIAGPWGHPDWPDADGLGCFRRAGRTNGIEWSSDYYALNPQSPRCELLRFRAGTGNITAESAVTIHQQAAAALERELGASRDPGKVHGWGSAYWSGIRQWDRDGLRILLFIRQGFPPTPAGPRVEILAEHHGVLRVRQEEAALRGGSAKVQRTLTADVEALLRAELKSTLPELNAMLAGEPYESPFGAGELRQTIQSLLDLASKAEGPRKAALLLAADRLAFRLGWKLGTGVGEQLGAMRTETSAKLRFELDHYSGWVYKHDLLRQIWRDHGDTQWGEAAFALLQEGGWYFGRACPENPVFFPAVITNGEPFLKNHPASAYRLETVFQLAQAYEDWWNAANPPDEHFALSPEKYNPQMDEMRQKAIASYQQLLEAEPDSPLGRWAAVRLPRLKLGLRTDRFRFVDSCH